MGKVYSRKFYLKNLSNCDIKFEIDGENISEYLLANITEQTGILKGLESKEIEVSFESFKVLKCQRAEFMVNFDIANSVNFEILGDFTGPSV